MVVYKVEDGIAKDHLGRYNDVDYRQQFENFKDGVYAQGHKPAFGFMIEEEYIDDVMKSLGQ